MREIKFRAWNKRLNILKEVIAIYFDEERLEVTRNEYDLAFYWRFDCIKLMQYTGLKDKNGTDIYEGDIIKLHGYFITQVCFEDGSFVIEDENNGYADGDIHIIKELLFNRLDTCEIIGNIHENPELTENK